MRTIFSIIFISFNFCSVLFAQEKEDINPDSNDYSTALKSTQNKINTNNFENVDLHNLAIYHYHLKHNKDTVLNALLEAIAFDPIFECNSVFKPPFSFVEIVGENYHPKRIKEIKCFCDTVESLFNPALRVVLKNLYKYDQKFRNLSEQSINKEEKNNLRIAQAAIDELNFSIIDSIVNKLGYPGRTLAGSDLADVAFFIILHTNNLNVLNRYMPIIEKAILDKQIEKKLYPLFYDRRAMLSGIPQKFGTQLIYNSKKKRMELYKVKDMSKVNQYRKEYKLSNLASYLKSNDAFLPDE